MFCGGLCMCLVSWWFMDMFSLVVYGYMCFAVVYAYV